MRCHMSMMNDDTISCHMSMMLSINLYVSSTYEASLLGK